MTSLPFDADAVRSLAIILADTGLTEIEIEGKEGRIRVARAPAQIAAAPGRVPGMRRLPGARRLHFSASRWSQQSP